MRELPIELLCPSCKRPMTKMPPDVPRPRAHNFESCIRRCDTCKIGASNGDQPELTYIYLDPVENIPKQCRNGVLQALGSALNSRNRPSKRIKFGFSTSEDALTWVVFTYLRSRHMLVRTFQEVGVLAPGNLTTEPVLLLWGAPIGPDSRSSELRAKLSQACRELNEDPERMSEPDVVIDCGALGIVILEVKYRSPNEIKPENYGNWWKYESAGRLAWHFNDVRATGYYELARYWCLMEKVAGGRPATLINLGLPSLFEGEQGRSLDRFVRTLDQTEQRQFKTLTWSALLTPALATAEKWFSDYCHDKAILLR